MPELNEVENFENEGGAVPPAESGGGSASPPPSPGADAPQGVSAEEFRALQQRYQQMESWIANNFFVDEEPEPEGGPDPMQLVDQRVAPLEAFARSYAQDQGDKKFNELMDEYEKDPSIGKVHNRAIAFHFAEQSYEEARGNAALAVKLGAQKAAAYEKELREAGREELKQTLKRPSPGGDEFGPGGGEPGRKDYKSYDEVRDAWAAQSEL